MLDNFSELFIIKGININQGSKKKNDRSKLYKTGEGFQGSRH